MQTAAVAGGKAVQDAVKESPLPNN
jgi:hypothetical protein